MSAAPYEAQSLFADRTRVAERGITANGEAGVRIFIEAWRANLRQRETPRATTSRCSAIVRYFNPDNASRNPCRDARVGPAVVRDSGVRAHPKRQDCWRCQCMLLSYE